MDYQLVSSSIPLLLSKLKLHRGVGPFFFFSLAGYEATVFGVHHKCNMKISGNPFIRVIPQFPLLKVRSFPIQTALEKGEGQGVGGRRVSKAGIEKFDLMDGERCVKL